MTRDLKLGSNLKAHGLPQGNLANSCTMLFSIDTLAEILQAIPILKLSSSQTNNWQRAEFLTPYGNDTKSPCSTQ